ncbi:MAG: GldG family protein [Blastocatellia bacterium]
MEQQEKASYLSYVPWLGAALLVAGYVRYLVYEEMKALDKGLLIAGAALIVIGLALNFRSLAGFFTGRGGRLGTNTTLLTLAVIALLVVVNFLGYRHHKRFDLTSEGLYSLSDQTRKVVSGLKQDVKIIKFDKQDDPALRDTMQEFRDLSPKVSYERVDPQEKLGLARQYEVKTLGETIMTSNGRTEHLTGTGEQELTNALMKVTREKNKNICFIADHGERPTDGTGAEGMSAVAGELKNQNYDSKTVSIVSAEVPGDCEVLVVPGPKKAFFASETENLRKYLNAGGKALLLLDADTDPQLDSLLTEWNLAIGNDAVLDTSGVGRLFGLGAAAPVVTTYGSSPITQGMGRVMTVFPFARSVKVADAAKTEVTTTELIKTSPQSWAETDLKTPEASFNEGKDTRGPITLGYTASKKAGEKEARLVVIGDSDFAGNQFSRQQGNSDFFLNTVNWLAQDENLISIRPRSPANRNITLTETQKNLIWLLTVIFLPALVIVTGGYTWWKRR